jgi:Zn-dependent protease
VSTDTILYAVYLAVGLFLALDAREFVRASVAVRLGDHSARNAGRVTLDPRPHVDRFGTLVLPAILLLPVLFGNLLFPVFAYAKPLPLNPWNLRNRGRDSVWIALAGPITNVAMAFVYGALLRVGTGGQLGRFLGACLIATVIMAVMQLVPLPGLDGSKIVGRFLPPRAQEVYASLDAYLALFILLVFFILPGPIFAFIRVIGNGICSLVAGGPCL